MDGPKLKNSMPQKRLNNQIFRVNAKRLSTTSAYQGYDSPIGLLHILASNSHILAIMFASDFEDHHNYFDLKSNKVTNLATKELEMYFCGKLKKFSVPVSSTGTIFQSHCETFLKAIPFGETRTYLQQATSVKSSKHARAVAGANAKNPISIIVPCHRVLGSHPRSGGYAGGVESKQKLLFLEKYGYLP